ncbi:MAG TPA: LuxR C-terminal-related transcriptional regulator, partial [Thermoleophilia bacterium]|nr:LuxR C-terminal-related transcriptional regulator [Thermoleophilia bacterium]
MRDGQEGTDMSRPAGHPEKPLALSRREAQVALLIALGKTNKEIAAQLGLSDQTVKEYVSKA